MGGLSVSQRSYGGVQSQRLFDLKRSCKVGPKTSCAWGKKAPISRIWTPCWLPIYKVLYIIVFFKPHLKLVSCGASLNHEHLLLFKANLFGGCCSFKALLRSKPTMMQYVPTSWLLILEVRWLNSAILEVLYKVRFLSPYFCKQRFAITSWKRKQHSKNPLVLEGKIDGKRLHPVVFQPPKSPSWWHWNWWKLLPGFPFPNEYPPWN